ncbi:MAG: DUF721 domain-containing protein [Epsilonproteobacteria bacterium]|nr:DUF721 domain-containing protein [Campylobacterota bacterium]
MKKANEIISHLFKPFEGKLKIHRCLKQIIALLPQNYKKFIKNSFLKGEVLYIEVTHPAMRQEIYYKRDLIFSIIKQMHKLNMCQNVNPKKIITSYKYTPPPPPPKEIKFFLKEANDFEIKAKDEEIRKKFEEIRQIISS